MLYLYITTAILLIFSFIADSSKTIKSVSIALKRFRGIIPAFLVMLIFTSVILFLFPSNVIVHYLGKGGPLRGIIFASMLGSITLVPGFIVYPLCGILLDKGAAYTTISAFTTTLMMVGVLTYPVERKYFGTKVTIIRNAVSFCIALIVALMTGIFFGEIF